MKRCIICGHVGKDNGETCEICGNPYVDIAEDGPGERTGSFPDLSVEQEPGESQAAAALESVEKKDADSDGQAEMDGKASESLAAEKVEEEPVAETPDAQQAPEAEEVLAQVSEPSAEAVNASGDFWEKTGFVKDEEDPEKMREAFRLDELDERQQKEKAQESRQPQQAASRAHKMKSGPTIYGQSGANQEDYGQQGVIRRNVQGRPSKAAQGPAGTYQRTAQARPANGGPVNPSRPANPTARPVNGQGRPVNGSPANPAARPVNGQGRPVNGSPVNPAARPANGQGRPMNAAPGNMAGRSMGMAQGHQARQIMETARAALKSPVFILIALFNTVYFVSSIAAIFMNELNYSQIVRLLQEINLPAQAAGYMDSVISLLSSLDSGHIILNIVLNIPELLFCIGLWLIVVTAFAARENMSGVGFGFVKAVVIINMVKTCVVMLAVLIVTVAIAIAAWVSAARNMMIMSVIALVAVIVVVMMVIMYYFCYLATLKTCRKNANTGESYGRVSAYVAVVHIILALTACVGLLSGIVNSEITGITGSAGKLLWMILFGVWIIMYRGQMSEYED